MADILNRVALHFVWATYDRLPYLTPAAMAVVEECVRQACDERRSPVIAIGGVEDHVHVLLHFATTVSISDLAQEMKGGSARVVNLRFPDANFRWQGGYGVFPVPPNARNSVTDYIARQEEHHRAGTAVSSLEITGRPSPAPSSGARGGGLEQQ